MQARVMLAGFARNMSGIEDYGREAAAATPNSNEKLLECAGKWSTRHLSWLMMLFTVMIIVVFGPRCGLTPHGTRRSSATKRRRGRAMSRARRGDRQGRHVMRSPAAREVRGNSTSTASIPPVSVHGRRRYATST